MRINHISSNNDESDSSKFQTQNVTLYFYFFLRPLLVFGVVQSVKKRDFLLVGLSFHLREAYVHSNSTEFILQCYTSFHRSCTFRSIFEKYIFVHTIHFRQLHLIVTSHTHDFNLFKNVCLKYQFFNLP